MEFLSAVKNSILGDGGNPILNHFDIGRQIGSAGPEHVWKIYEATTKTDKKDACIFMFEKKIADKLHKPKRREAVTEILKKEVKNLGTFAHPRILQVLHPLEESYDSVAFASEPVSGSLANFLGNYGDKLLPMNMGNNMVIMDQHRKKEFVELEVKYGILQIAEALHFLHTQERCLHGNVNPTSILLTKRGGWRLAGLGFVECATSGTDSFRCNPWTPKSPKMTQPDLEYMAPEIQLEQRCTSYSDMFSLGMSLCAIYNNGKSLIDANYNPQVYTKKISSLSDSFGYVANKMPVNLIEPAEKMINRDIRYRPSAQNFLQLKYMNDPVIQCLQYLDSLDQKEKKQNVEFFSKTLVHTIPKIHKKVIYQHVFPYVIEQLQQQTTLQYTLLSLIAVVEASSREEYKAHLKVEVNKMLASPKPLQSTIVILERLQIIMAKTPYEELNSQVLPIVFATLESGNVPGQEVAFNTLATVKDFLEESAFRRHVLPRCKKIYKATTNVKIKVACLICIDRLMDRMDKSLILDDVLPFLTEIPYQDTEVLMAVIGIFRHMLIDKRCGLSHNLVATKVMPALLPYTVTAILNIDEFNLLMVLLHDMFDLIEQHRRTKMKQETTNQIHPESPQRVSSLKMSQHQSRSAHNLQEEINRAQMNGHHANPQGAYLSVEGFAGVKKSRTAPSTPELKERQRMAHHSASSPLSQRRTTSTHVLGSDAMDDTPNSSPEQRKYNLLPEGPRNPGINLVSDGALSPSMPRRLSSQSLGSPIAHRKLGVPQLNGERQRRHSTGPVVLPEMDRRSRNYSGYITPPSFGSRQGSMNHLNEASMYGQSS